MKVLFICGSLEEEKDGIGDYTIKLAHECYSQGISPILVSVNDRYVSATKTGTINNIPFYRFPQATSWKKKGDELMEILNVNSPVDWISIQFVSYAFNSKGIVWDMKPFFSRFSAWKTHIMMHELWVAGERQASFKMKVLGLLQTRALLSLIKVIKPNIVQTSIPLYKKMLALQGISSTVLPLFSNIGYHNDKPSAFDREIPAYLTENRDKYIVGCLFGSIYNDSWDLSSLFTILKREKDRSGKEIMLVSIGKISYGKAFWESLPFEHRDINFLTLGPRDERFISTWLNNFVDFGIVTTPAIIAGKSGSCMAFLEHGIPVLCKENSLLFGFEITDDMIDKRIIQISETTNLEIPEPTMPSAQIKNTAQTLLQTLRNFKE